MIAIKINYIFGVFIGILVLASIALNIVLVQKVLSYYKANNLLRLDPLETSSLNETTKNIASKKKNRLILLFGDSRIANWHPEINIPGWRVINQGIRGQTTSQLLLRLKNDVLTYSPDVVILQAGINDLKNISMFPNNKNSIVMNCRENLFNIINILAVERIQIIVLTIFPTGKPNLIRTWFWSSETNSAIININNEIKTLRKNNVHIVDSHETLRDGDYIFSEYKKDLLHLNYKGYLQLNKMLLPLLNDISVQQSKH